MRASVILSAIVAALVGFGGTLAIVVAAAQAVGADAAATASWVTALCLAIGATSAWLSVRHRIPIITAWSTPGAALIAASSGAVPLDAAAGAFLLAGMLVLATAALRPVADLVNRIPASVAAAMLAGILVGFVMAVFQHAQAEPGLVLPLLCVFLVTRLLSPSGAVLATLAAGLLLTFGLGLAADMDYEARLPTLVPMLPRFDLPVLIGLGLPLYLVTMASQNLPGFAVLRASHYPVPSRSILAATGLASVVTAPFGAHSTNLAAITASICTGEDAHPDPHRRWLTGPVYGVAYLLLALSGASSVMLLAAMPPALIATAAGVALLGPLTNALAAALVDPERRFAATLTFAATASGVTLAGIGSAFWGLIAGLAALLLQEGVRRAGREGGGRKNREAGST